MCSGSCANDGSGQGHFLWPAEGAGPPVAWCRRHSRATVLSTPAVGRASLFPGRFQCGSSTMSKKIKMHLRPFERAVSLSASGEGDSHPKSPRGRGRGGGRVNPPLSPPLQAWLSPQGTVMAAAWTDTAQVSGRCFWSLQLLCCFGKVSWAGWSQVRRWIPLCPCRLFTSGVGLSLYLQS